MKRTSIMFLVLCAHVVFAQFNLYLESKIPVSAERVSCIKISRDGRFLAYSENSGGVYVWDINAKRLLHELKLHRGQVSALVFDKQQRFLISGGNDRKIVVWDLYSGQPQQVIKDFGSSVRWLDMSPDDRLFAASGNKKEIYLWEFPICTLKGKLKGHEKNVVAVAFNVNGDQLMSVGEDRRMIVWNVNKLQIMRKTSIEARTMKDSGIDIKSAAFSFDSHLQVWVFRSTCWPRAEDG